MQFKLSIVLVSLTLLLMSKCEDPFPAGLETTVSGHILDETINSPLEGQKIENL